MSESSKKFAAFDIDGTLIRWQLYHVVVDRLAKKGALGPDAHKKIHDARMRWKRREDSDGFYTYEKALITLYDQAVTAVDPADFDQMVNEVITEYRDQVYSFTRDLVTRLKAKDYVLFAISGSQKELVEHIAAYYGFDDAIGSEYHRSDGQFSGTATIASHDKQSALQSLISKHDATITDSYAIGDSLSDAPMLAMVENPIAFNPDKKLYTKAIEQSWPIILERKNVVYHLENTNGIYQLVKTN